MSTTDEMTELAAAFEEFQRLGARGRDWPAWSALFTDDATYIEHCIGRFRGGAGVLAFMEKSMPPVAPMTFSVDWAILQPPYVAFNIWNHMPDPTGTGARYSFSNLSLLIYAGNGRWRWEEDFYAPNDSSGTVIEWYKAGGRPDMPADPSITHVSAAPEPVHDDPEGVARMVEAWQSGSPRYTDDAEVWRHGVGKVAASETEPFGDTAADVVVTNGRRAFLRCDRTGVALTHGGDGRIRFEERAFNPSEVVPEPAA